MFKMMKKNIFKTIVVSAMALAALTSCELDLYPSGNIPSDKSFQSKDDAAKFATGMHAFYRALKYGGYTMYEDIQTEMFNAAVNFGNNGGDFHIMGDNFNSSSQSVSSIWSNSYAGLITNANNFLDNVTVLEDYDTDKDLRVYQGYAYFYRADIHFELARRFCYPYDPTTAKDANTGIPYITTVNPNLLPNRGTLEETYQNIVSDLQKAAEYLKDEKGAQKSDKPTIDAVKALRAKVALYMKQYDTAAKYSQEIIESGTYQLATDEESMKQEWINDSGKESIFQIYCSMSEGANTMSYFLSYDKQSKTYSPFFIPTQETLDLYTSENDLRRKVWFTELRTKYPDVGYENVTLLTKFQGNPEYDVDEENKSFLNQPKAYRLGIIYLINAEANYMRGEEGLAKDALNALQSARGAEVTDAAGDVLFTAIQDEWKRETVGEGYRLDCIKRWKQSVVRGTPQVEAVVYAPALGKVYGEDGSDIYYQFVWPVPASEFQSNPNLGEQNRGW